MTDFEIVQLPEQHTAVVRATLPMTQLRDLFDRGFSAVFPAVAQQGATMVSAPFGFYPSMPGDEVTVEVGVAVAGPIEPVGDVVPSRLPGGRVARGVHVGPYERLEATYAELQQWAQEHDVRLAEGMWECYLSDPSAEPDPETWRTEINWPLV